MSLSAYNIFTEEDKGNVDEILRSAKTGSTVATPAVQQPEVVETPPVDVVEPREPESVVVHNTGEDNSEPHDTGYQAPTPVVAPRRGVVEDDGHSIEPEPVSPKPVMPVVETATPDQHRQVASEQPVVAPTIRSQRNVVRQAAEKPRQPAMRQLTRQPSAEKQASDKTAPKGLSTGEKQAVVAAEPLKVDPKRVSEVKGVPRAIIDRLRAMLSTAPGFDAARVEKLSMPTIVTGYLVSQLNIARDGLPAATCEVAEAFVAYNPMLHQLYQLVAQVDNQGALLQRVQQQVKSTHDVVDAADLGISYLLAERTGQLDTSHVVPRTMDMTQKKVVEARQRMHQQADHLAQAERRVRGSSHYYR